MSHTRTRPSLSAEASRERSMKFIEYTFELWPRRVRIWLLVAQSQTWMSPCELPVTSLVLSGVKATSQTGNVVLMETDWLPPAAAHTRAVESVLAVAM